MYNQCLATHIMKDESKICHNNIAIPNYNADMVTFWVNLSHALYTLLTWNEHVKRIWSTLALTW